MKLLDEDGNEIPIKVNRKGQVICNSSKTKLVFDCSICGKESVFTLKGYISKRGRITPDSRLICRSCNKIIKIAENRAVDEEGYDFSLFNRRLNIPIPIRLNEEGNVPYIADCTVRFKCSICGKESEKTLESFKGNLNKDTELLCRECSLKEGFEKQAKTNEEYLAELIDKGLDKVYDLSKVSYVNAKTKVTLICRKCGTEFEHEPRTLASSKGVFRACPNCNYFVGERIIEKILIEHGFIKNEDYFPQYSFKELGRKSVDFYLPKLNTVIEYQGIQHYEPCRLWGGEERLALQKKRDQEKRDFFKASGINELEIRYDENILTRLEESGII